MATTLSRRVPLCLLLFMLAMPAAGSGAPVKAPAPAPAATRRPFTAAGLYSPRARRAAQIYLRLRLLEMRETDLDRARAVIERRLGIGALLDGPAPEHSPPGK